MRYTLEEIAVGAAVHVRTWMGDTVAGVVTNVEADVKNGRPGIDYRLAAGGGGLRWAYLDQVTWVGVSLVKVPA